jgi:cytosine/adenosine deaminase-related metal-dependent hydrolase
VDPFADAYLAGVTAAAGGRALAPRAAPAGPVALRGCLLTPDGPLPDGYLVVDGDTIAAVSPVRPEGVRVHDTGGVILPGLIDLHGHPEFNVFPAWEPPRRFANRYEWRASGEYRTLIRDPQHVLLAKVPPLTQLRYAEIRALVGGVTAIQGATSRAAGESLVRNVDLRIFGDHRARAVIDLPATDAVPAWFTAILDDIAARRVDVFYLHLAEGRRDDPATAADFARMVDLHALTPATVVVHGAGLTVDQFDALARQGRGLVWSPQSNLRLYGETTDAAAALDRGVPLALGADWLPTGSASLLAELRVARRELSRQGRPLPPSDLVHMITAGAAELAGLGDRLGTLAPGRPADVLILERVVEDPYENVCCADPSRVELVMIGGELCYGRADWIRGLSADPGPEPVIAWGKRMVLDLGDGAGTLAGLRVDLVGVHPGVGPIFA